MTTPNELFSSGCHCQIAPAGYGKTHLITEAVTFSSDKPQLILTHTHAGVNAIRERMRKQQVNSSKYQVETLDGWALKWATAYPQKSSINHAECVIEIDWNAVRTGLLNVIDCQVVRNVIANSYAGVFVDEYQDCCPDQHALVTTLSDFLPVRVLGDPLQGIFDFGENVIVDWENDVEGYFSSFPALVTPWRWRNINDQLGEQLALIRQHLLDNIAFDLRRREFSAIAMRMTEDVDDEARATFFSKLRDCAVGEKIAVIFPVKNQARSFARRIGGRASAIETVECQELVETVQTISEKTGVERGVALIELLKSCMTQIGNVLARPIQHLRNGNLPDASRMRKFVNEAQALRTAIESEEAVDFHKLIQVIEAAEGVSVFRKEFVSRLKRALLGCCVDSELSISDSLSQVREQDRFYGKRTSGHVVGTTLLLKGLEFDHVIVVNAQQLNKKNFYVALTRGTKSVTVIDHASSFNFN